MSYDTSILLGEDDAEEIGNYTSNVWPMFHRALPGPYEGGGRYDGTGATDPRGGLPGLSGLTCAAALPLLDAALQEMHAREAEMRALEPSNGWGSYSGAVEYLRRIRDAAQQHPDGIIAVNW